VAAVASSILARRGEVELPLRRQGGWPADGVTARVSAARYG
jgi:hypothetical protein